MTDQPVRPVMDEVRALRRSLSRVYLLLLIPVVPVAALVAGTVLRFFFPETPVFVP